MSDEQRIEWPKPRPDPEREPLEPWARDDASPPDWAKIRKELADRAHTSSDAKP